MDQAADHAAEPPSSSALEILVGTNDDSLLGVLRKEFDENGLTVAHARSCAELTAIAALDEPDAVLVDASFASSRDWHVERLRAVSGAALIVLVDGDEERRVLPPPGADAYVAAPPLDDLLHILAIVRQLGTRSLGVRNG